MPKGLNCVLAFTGLGLAILCFWPRKRRESILPKPVDIVEESSLESFPASDAPAWNPPGSVEAT